MSDDRTLEPTLRRRQQARQEGRVAATPWLAAAITWLAIFVLGNVSADWLGTTLLDASYRANMSASQGSVSEDVVQLFNADPVRHGSVANEQLLTFVRQTALRVSVWLVPCLLAIVGLSVLARVAQVGFLWVPQRIVPDASRVLASHRVANLFSLDAMFQCMRGFLFVALVLGLLCLALWEGRQTIEMQTQREIASSIRFVCQWGIRLGGVLLLFALLDYAYQYRRLDASLKMTVEEMRAEVKAVQGSSALVAGRRKQYQHTQQ